jgi:hypothetical protein
MAVLTDGQPCKRFGRLSNALARRIQVRSGRYMTTLARTLCTIFAVAILAAMNLHGVTQSQHAMAHMADWPAVALADASGNDDHHGTHVHVAPEESPEGETDPGDRDADGDRPVGHHHHGGGDNHGAVAVLSRALADVPRVPTMTLDLRTGPPLASLSGDGPEYPPKRTLTVI